MIYELLNYREENKGAEGKNVKGWKEKIENCTFFCIVIANKWCKPHFLMQIF